MVRTVLSDGLLFALPPPGLTVSTCKGQDQRPLSWCVFTHLADSERSPQTGEMRPRGPVPITNTLAVLLNPQKKREWKIETNPSLLHMVPITQMLSHCWKYFSIFYWKAGTGLTVVELQLCLNLSPQPSGEVASGNLFSHRLGPQALPNTDNWWSAGVRQRCFIMRILTSI